MGIKLTGLITISSLVLANFFKSLSSVVRKYSASPSIAHAIWSASLDFTPFRVNSDALATTLLGMGDK